MPKRDTVQLTIYNSEDLTLVRETRTVTFKKGVNPLQFSWANTLIDPTSVELQFLTSAEKLEVLDTTFPHDKPQMLYWNVQSDFDGEATVEITYFTSGITWSADYVCVADKDEKQLKLEGFVRVTNNSGEEYEDAQVRLVVGTINLVEKIAQLAHVPMDADVGASSTTTTRTMLSRSRAKDADASMRRRRPCRQPTAPAEPKQIIKEGLSEYFIYTIEGTETIPNGWIKRLRSFEGDDGPFKIQYRYRPQEYGDQLVRMYLLTNDKASKLGTTPLPDGSRARLPRQRPRRPHLPHAADDQIHPDRRQDRAEPRRRSDRLLRAGQAAGVPRQHLAAAQRRECLQAGGPAGRADRREFISCRLGRPRGLQPAGAEITRASRLRWRFGEALTGMSFSAAALSRSCTITRHRNSLLRSTRGRRPICSSRSCDIRVATANRIT